MYYITVKDGKIKHAFEGDPQEGDIEISRQEFDMVQACHGNLDNGINALVKVAEKILAGALAEKKAVIFPERAPLKVGDRVVTTEKGCCNIGFEDGTIATIIEIEPDGGYDLESYAHNYRQSGCHKCISRA